jgi:hypothetical protein
VDCRNRRYSAIRREAKMKRRQTNLLKRNALMVVQLQVGIPTHYLQKAGEHVKKELESLRRGFLEMRRPGEG